MRLWHAVTRRVRSSFRESAHDVSQVSWCKVTKGIQKAALMFEGTGKAATAVEEPGDRPYCDAGVHLVSQLQTASASSPKVTSLLALDLRTTRELLFPTMRFAVNIHVGREDFGQNIAMQNTSDWVHSAYGYVSAPQHVITVLQSAPCPTHDQLGGVNVNFVSHYIKQEVFRRFFLNHLSFRQMKRAIEFQKTLVVHTRDADDDSLRLMTEVLPSSHPSHPVTQVDQNLPHNSCEGFHIFPNIVFGLTGVITYQCSDTVPETIQVLPLDHIVLDTCVPIIASEVARLKGISHREVLQITLANTMRIYTIRMLLEQNEKNRQFCNH
ncbi:hypothetical protein Pelo_1870 [Pelomyxa schiedti]|nr:hypothetical protein Pelo_1870 [Pelomyxa schiedti]